MVFISISPVLLQPRICLAHGECCFFRPWCGSNTWRQSTVCNPGTRQAFPTHHLFTQALQELETNVPAFAAPLPTSLVKLEVFGPQVNPFSGVYQR